MDTYGQEDIDTLHDHKDHIPNFRLMVAIACEHQDACDEMMSEHLPMIFPALLDVDDKDLLEPKGELNEIVPLHQAFGFPIWPSRPLLL